MDIGSKRGITRESAKDKSSRLWGAFKTFCKNIQDILKDWKEEGDDHFKPYYAIIFPIIILLLILGAGLIITSYKLSDTPLTTQMNDTVVVAPEPSEEPVVQPVGTEDEVVLTKGDDKVKISFESILADAEKYDNTFINITGYLNFKLINEEYVKILQDDYGNQLALTFYMDSPNELFVLDKQSKEHYFIYGKFRDKYPLDALDVYDMQLVYNSNMGAKCDSDDDCVTPMEYLIQSNCPFGSACIENTCKVICPFTFNDPDPHVNATYPVPCDSDWDCDCSMRGERSILCMCLDGGCVSVEGE